MKKHISICLGILICGCSLLAADAPSIRLKVRVVDPDGKPVSGLDIGIGGGLSTPEGKYPRKANGVTDQEGQFSATIASRDGMVGAFARGDKYYGADVSMVRLYRKGEYARDDMKNAESTGRWEPWEQTIHLVIRPIKNPVPMYAKHIACALPAKSTWLGYDVQKGDWLSPYGQGEQADLEFFYEGQVESSLNYDGKLSLRFPGTGNGIQAFEQDQVVHSEFRLPYEAPQEGYVTSWSWRNARFTENKNGAISTFIDERFLGRNFIFRVRSGFDVEGKVVKAWYGKIHSPVILDPRGDRGCGYLEFTYYVNPDQTRNLEFDPSRNLLKGQNVKAP